VSDLEDLLAAVETGEAAFCNGCGWLFPVEDLTPASPREWLCAACWPGGPADEGVADVAFGPTGAEALG
jgi:hypothetical protein